MNLPNEIYCHIISFLNDDFILKGGKSVTYELLGSKQYFKKMEKRLAYLLMNRKCNIHIAYYHYDSYDDLAYDEYIHYGYSRNRKDAKKIAREIVNLWEANKGNHLYAPSNCNVQNSEAKVEYSVLPNDCEIMLIPYSTTCSCCMDRSILLLDQKGIEKMIKNKEHYVKIEHALGEKKYQKIPGVDNETTMKLLNKYKEQNILH